MVRLGMGILDLPKGLIARLPLIGSSDDAKDDPGEANEPENREAKPDSDPDGSGREAEQPSGSDSEPDSDPDGSGREAEQPSGSDSNGSGSEAEQPSGSDEQDVSDITAPSIGPNTKIEKEDPEERLARHEQSDTDAMGLDKRREVIGGNYSASFGKQLFRWGLVVVVIAGGAFGAKILVDDLDKPPAKAADEAPWTGTKKEAAELE